MDVSDFVRNVLTKKSIVEHSGTQKYAITSFPWLLTSPLFELGMAYFSEDSDDQIRDKVQGWVAKIHFSHGSQGEDEGILYGGSSNDSHQHHGCSTELSSQVKDHIISKLHVQSSQSILSKWTVSRPMCRSLEMVMMECILLSDTTLLSNWQAEDGDISRFLYGIYQPTSSLGRNHRSSGYRGAPEISTDTSSSLFQHASDSSFSSPITDPTSEQVKDAHTGMQSGSTPVHSSTFENTTEEATQAVVTSQRAERPSMLGLLRSFARRRGGSGSQ